jgi:uncharacterized protein with HEPN domain
MQLEARKLLFDVGEAAKLIGRFTEGRSFSDYTDDPMLCSAVERQFEIMGEALSKPAKVDSVTASRVADYRRIIAFRNLLIHGYDAIQHEVVWGIAIPKPGGAGIQHVRNLRPLSFTSLRACPRRSPPRLLRPRVAS